MGIGKKILDIIKEKPRSFFTLSSAEAAGIGAAYLGGKYVPLLLERMDIVSKSIPVEMAQYDNLEKIAIGVGVYYAAFFGYQGVGGGLSLLLNKKDREENNIGFFKDRWNFFWNSNISSAWNLVPWVAVWFMAKDIYPEKAGSIAQFAKVPGHMYLMLLSEFKEVKEAMHVTKDAVVNGGKKFSEISSHPDKYMINDK